MAKEKDLEVECTSCGCDLLITPGTTKKGYCCFFGYESVLIPVGSHLCDYCEDHFRRD